MTRERARTIRRRRAEFLIHAGVAQRRGMTEEQKNHFLDAIDQNVPNEVGHVQRASSTPILERTRSCMPVSNFDCEKDNGAFNLNLDFFC